jgi:heat shock protein HslJ
MKKIILLTALFIAIISANVFAEGPKLTEAFPDTSTWILVRMGGAKAKQQTGNKIFITVDKKEQKVSGYTSCNFIRGQVSMKDSTISFPELSFGKRVCDEATTDLEKQLLENFQKANSWAIKDNILYLYDKGILILEFKTTGK